MHPGYWNKVTDQEIRLLQLSKSLQLTAGRNWLVVMSSTLICKGKLQGTLEHMQEGTREESRPRMETGHQQRHSTVRDGVACHASQCKLSCGHLRQALAGKVKGCKSKRVLDWIMHEDSVGKDKWATTSSTGKMQQAYLVIPSLTLPYPTISFQSWIDRGMYDVWGAPYLCLQASNFSFPFFVLFWPCLLLFFQRNGIMHMLKPLWFSFWPCMQCFSMIFFLLFCFLLRNEWTVPLHKHETCRLSHGKARAWKRNPNGQILQFLPKV